MTIATSIREQLLEAIEEAFDADGGPTGLTVHRERTRPIETDSLPAILFYAEDEDPRPLGGEMYRAPQVERQLSIAVQCRAQGSVEASPDEVLDPVLVWALQQMFLDETFGGLANGVEEGRTVWSSREGDVPVAAATIHLTVKYRTSRLDPTSKA
jgi:hypothetical protein